MLNDDAIKSIGQSIGILYGAESYVSFASTCKRFRRLLLLPPSASHTSKREEDANDDSSTSTGDDQTSDRLLTNQVVEYVISLRVRGQYRSLCPACKPERIFFPNNIKTLHQLSIFEKWITTTNFMNDNRITFLFASTEIESNMIDRIHQITMLMKRYPKLRVRLDAHCGTAAPSGISSWFSRARGMSVWTGICGTEHDDNGIINEGSIRTTTEEDNDNEEETGIDYTGRFQLVVWGKMITKVVSKLTQHPYYTDASEGRGWVEVYFVVSGDNNDREVEDEMILPRRHAYYNYRSAESTDSDTDSDESVVYHHHHPPPVVDLGNL